MDDFENNIAEVAGVGAKVYAVSVDAEDKAKEVADGVSFPIAFGATRADGELIDSWWEDRRNFIQPSEFLMVGKGRVLMSSYSSGPLGRFLASDVVKIINYMEAQKKKAGR